MSNRRPIASYSVAFQSAMRAAVAALESRDPHARKALEARMVVDLRQNLTAREALRRLLKGDVSSGRISWQLVEFGRKLAQDTEQAGFEAEADALRATGAAYVAVASPAAVERFMSIPEGEMDDLLLGFPRRIADLLPFARLSDAEPAIRVAHSELILPKRRQLYESWYLKNRRAFLTLFRVTVRGTHDPIAVSIVLPLKAEARERIAEASWQLADIEDAIDHSDTPRVVLIDTWIVKRVTRPAKGDDLAKREPHRRWAMAMIGYHLAQFVHRDRPVSILVEPDAQHIHHLCGMFGFTAERGNQLWTLNLPTGKPALDERIYRFIEDSRTMDRA